jgi:hypothetical protein
MKKGVRPVRLKPEFAVPIFWNDTEDLESKIDYSELFGNYVCFLEINYLEILMFRRKRTKKIFIFPLLSSFLMTNQFSASSNCQIN